MPDGMTTTERARLERQAPGQTLPDQTSPASSRAAPKRHRTTVATRQLLRYALMGGAALVILVVGGWYWLSGGRYVTTTDSYVQANVLDVATDVSGVVSDIPVHDGEQVKAGQVLFRLDPLKFQLAVDQAQAGLEQTRLDLESLKADYTRDLTAQAAQAAQVQSDQATFARDAALVKTNAVTQQQYDTARFKLQGDEAQLGSAEAQVKSALARLGGDPALPPTRDAGLQDGQGQAGRGRARDGPRRRSRAV